jgi:hypothetical protein
MICSPHKHLENFRETDNGITTCRSPRVQQSFAVIQHHRCPSACTTCDSLKICDPKSANPTLGGQVDSGLVSVQCGFPCMLFFGSRSPRAPTKTDLVTQLRFWESIEVSICIRYAFKRLKRCALFLPKVAHVMQEESQPYRLSVRSVAPR